MQPLASPGSECHVQSGPKNNQSTVRKLTEVSVAHPLLASQAWDQGGGGGAGRSAAGPLLARLTAGSLLA